MVSPISTISIGATVYQLLEDTSKALRYSSLNELLKFVLSIAANEELIDDFYLEEANRQLAAYKHLNQLIGLANKKAAIHIRIDPELKTIADDAHLLAGLMFLNVVSTEPTSVYHLSEDEMNQLIQSHPFD